MSITYTRRQVVALAALAGISPSVLRARAAQPDSGWSLPIRDPGGVPGNGFFIRNGYACENTWYSPNNWHAGEDWYRNGDADTSGAEVLASHAGDVAWIGSDYPGRVVLIQHASDSYSMYGHLDYGVDVAEGQQVTAGQVLGRVLAPDNWRAPSHLHFEMRTFFYNPIVNGETPQYGFQCGYQCPPGPGYWPMGDSRHPSEIGWRNPMHVIAKGIARQERISEVMVASGADGLSGPVRSEPSHDASGLGNITLRSGNRFPIVGMSVGDPATTETSAYAYRVWYEVEREDGSTGWLPGFLADDREVGFDGRPSSLRPVLVPVPV